MRIFVLPEPELCNFTEAEDLQLVEFEQKIQNIYNYTYNQNEFNYQCTLLSILQTKQNRLKLNTKLHDLPNVITPFINIPPDKSSYKFLLWNIQGNSYAKKIILNMLHPHFVTLIEPWIAYDLGSKYLNFNGYKSNEKLQIQIASGSCLNTT